MSDQVVVELHQRYPFDVDKIQGYLALLDEDGAWSDIDYADTKRSGWEPKRHAERILEMAKLYYTPGTRLYQAPQVMASLHRALGFWLSRRPRCLNWWYNEIGVPKTLGAAFVLLERELTAEEKEGAIEVMKAARFRMTGQNKVWLAGNVLIRALLQDDPELVQAARDTIEGGAGSAERCSCAGGAGSLDGKRLLDGGLSVAAAGDGRQGVLSVCTGCLLCGGVWGGMEGLRSLFRTGGVMLSVSSEMVLTGFSLPSCM